MTRLLTGGSFNSFLHNTEIVLTLAKLLDGQSVCVLSRNARICRVIAAAIGSQGDLSKSSRRFVWSASIFGPDDTPWEGGIFSLRITFGESYPEKPPRVRFTSEMFHPNVYSDGTLCLDIIQEAWSPCHNVCTILTSIQSLLTDPNCASPANPDAAQAYQHKRKEYNRTVRRISQRSLDS